MNDIPPTTSQILLESLEKWTEYRITVVAHTEVGPGPESSPVIVRTDEDGNCTFSGFLPSPLMNTCPWSGLFPPRGRTRRVPSHGLCGARPKPEWGLNTASGPRRAASFAAISPSPS